MAVKQLKELKVEEEKALIKSSEIEL